MKPWTLDPVVSNVQSAVEEIQIGLIESKCNEKCKYKFEKGKMAECGDQNN